MGVIPSNNRCATNTISALWTTLQRIVGALDRLVAQRSRRTVPAVAMRGSDSDIRRCRQLMLEGAVDGGASAAWPRTW
jgi:hypothetical protein